MKTLRRPSSGSSLFKSACRLAVFHDVHRYLMANTQGRENGAEKALYHQRLCEFYVAVWYGLDDPTRARLEHEDEYQRVHDETQELTSYLDVIIRFPLDDPHPDYDRLAPLFFDRFHQLAIAALEG